MSMLHAYDMNNLPLLIVFKIVCVHVEFSRLCQQWGAFEWSWLSSFRADMAIYKVQKVLPSSTVLPTSSVTHFLQNTIMYTVIIRIER